MLNNKALKLLECAGLPIDTSAHDLLKAHIALINQWNEFASLVSSRDVRDLWDRHVVDSLSLAPVIQRVSGADAYLLDIGSGAGFPAIPAKIAIPKLRLCLVERSERKVAFLTKLLAMLGITETRIIQGDFPACMKERKSDAITARAVEKPDQLIRQIAEYIPEGCVFLCQSGDPSKKLPKGFHVEQVEDDWTRAGLRRGSLHLVRRVLVID